MKTPLEHRPTLPEVKRAIHLNMAANKVERAYLFGSYARGEAGPGSDIDIAIDMQADADLLDLIGFKQDLEEILKVKIDVTTRRSITPRLKSYVEPDLIPV